MASAPTRTAYLVRHGNRMDFVDPDWVTTADAPHDAPLSPDGVVQAKEVGQRLASEPIDHIFASPFLRAAETACHIAEALDLPVKIEAGLSEILLKRWFPVDPPLRTARELHDRWPRIDVSYASTVTPEYPETVELVAARAARVICALTEEFDGNLLLVGHGGSIHPLCNALVGARVSIEPRLCCLIRAEEDENGWRLTADGSDVSHLSAPSDTRRLM